jgi:hypothetical protein
MAGSSIQGNSIVHAMVLQASAVSGSPLTPTFDILPRTSGDIDIAKSFTQSELVDPTRQPSFNVTTGSEIAGSIESELAVDTPVLQTIVQGTMQNTYVTAISFNGSATFTNGTSSILAIGAFTNAVVGQFIGVFGTVSNDGVFKITTVTDNDNVVVSGAPTDETISCDIVSKAIRNSNVQQGLTVQKRIPTDSGIIYKTFENCQIGTLNLSITTGSIVTLNYDLIGLDKIAGDAIVSGQTDNPLDASRVAGSVNDVVEFWIDGIAQTTDSVCFTDFTISVDNSAQSNPAIGKEGACSISFSQAVVTGTLVSYVDGTDTTTANSEVAKRDAETLFSLAVVMKDVDGNILVISMPSIQYTELTQSDTANGDVLKNNGTFSGNGKASGYAIEFDFIAAP